MKVSFVKGRRQGDDQPGTKDKRRDLATEGKRERRAGEVVQKEVKEGEKNGKRCMGDKDGVMEGETDRGEHWRASKGEKGEERNQEGSALTPRGLSRELARRNLPPERHIIQNQELNLIVSRPCPSPPDE